MSSGSAVQDSASAEGAAEAAMKPVAQGNARKRPFRPVDDEATPPPNKRLNVPTEKEKEAIMREKELIYKRAAEAEKHPFFLKPHHPFLPLNFLSLAASSNKSSATTTTAFPAAGGVATPFHPLMHSPNQRPATGTPYPSSNNSTVAGSPSGAGGIIGAAAAAAAVMNKLPMPMSVSVQQPHHHQHQQQQQQTTVGCGGGGIVLQNPMAMHAHAHAHVQSTPNRPLPPYLYPALFPLPSPMPSPPSNNNKASNIVNIGTTATSTGTKLDSHGHGLSLSQQRQEVVVGTPPTSQQPAVVWQPALATNPAHGMMPNLMSPRSNNIPSVPSPLNYFHHASPISPMMLLNSPYASSLSSISSSSCPSVSSSSGCSSDHNISNSATAIFNCNRGINTSSGSISNSSSVKKRRFALSEYHVGPRPTLKESLEVVEEDVQSETGSNSGRNTPVVDPAESSSSADAAVIHVVEGDEDSASGSFVVPSSLSLSRESGVASFSNDGGGILRSSATVVTTTTPGMVPISTPSSSSSSSSSPFTPFTRTTTLPCPPSSSSSSSMHQHYSSGSSTLLPLPSPYPYSVESINPLSQPSSVNSQGYIISNRLNASLERPSSGVSSMSSSISSRDSTPDPEDQEDVASTTASSHNTLSAGGKHTLLSHGHHYPPQGHHHHHSHHHHPHPAHGGGGGGGGSEVFCLVPGRLSLLSSTQKYKVSVDEVGRRLSHPECLNASVLGGILRRAKSKNGGHVLRQRLEEIGVTLPPGRRKATELSLLTSLVEGESQHLSSDFKRICENYFPHTELAQIIARQHVGTPQAQDRISMVKASQLILSEMQAMLDVVGGPSNIRPSDPKNPYPGLTTFSLLSHGFGNPTVNASLSAMQTYLQELLNFYEGRKPILPESKYNQQHQQQVQHQQQTQQQDPSGGVCSAGGGTCSSTAPITLSHNDHEQSSSHVHVNVQSGREDEEEEISAGSVSEHLLLKQEPSEPQREQQQSHTQQQRQLVQQQSATASSAPSLTSCPV